MSNISGKTKYGLQVETSISRFRERVEREPAFRKEQFNAARAGDRLAQTMLKRAFNLRVYTWIEIAQEEERRQQLENNYKQGVLL